MKLLLAEDTRDLNRAVTTVLMHEKYKVDSVFDGEEAIAHVERNAYDCVLLDIMMPKKDGLEVLAEIRRRHVTVPVILLTAKGEIEDRVAGLDAGADDYLPKPFAMKELLARIRSACRRSFGYNNERLTFCDVELDPETLSLSAKNSISLSIKEYELLETLIRNSDRSLSEETLIGRIWRDAANANGDTLWLYVSYLKGKLTSIGSDVTIEGSRGGEYRLSGKGIAG